jgi:hypothetical protein
MILPPPFTTPPQSGAVPGLVDAAARAFGTAGSGGPLLKRGPDYTDDKKLLALAKTLKDEAWDNRFIFERGWWRIMLYALGRQWIYLDSQRGWVDKRMAKWIPRPVTNKIGETISSYRSVFQSVQLVARCRPNGNDPKNVTTAETADRLEPSIRDSHGYENVSRESDFWFITLGNVFLNPWWNKNGAPGNVVIPFEQCQACQTVSAPDEIVAANNTCPKCGTPGRFTEALDEAGEPIGMPPAGGCGVTDVCSPFEIGLPPGYAEFKDVSHLIRTRWRPKQYCEANWGDLAKTLKYDKMPTERSLQLLRALATTADSTTSPLSAATSGTVSTQAEGISEYELWLKPSRDYADGLLLRWAGDASPVIIRMENEGLPGPLPYHDVKGNPLFPWLHAGYEHMGGRIWARSPLEPLLSKQDQINQIDSLIQLIVQRTANPVWLEPKGAEVKKFTGEPGLVVKYNAMIGGGTAKPERIAGENIPPTLIQLRTSLLQDYDTLAGTSDILKGQRPPNVEAFSALQLLVERSQSRFGPALAERGLLYRGWYQLALELEREFGPEARVFSVLGPNQAWTFENYKKADLSGEISVLIEDGSQTPKTSLGKRAAIEQLNQLGLLDVTDAEQKYNIYKVFGSTDLVPSLDNDVKSALQEQDAFEKWANDPEASLVKPSLPPPMALPGQPLAGPPPAPMDGGSPEAPEVPGSAAPAGPDLGGDVAPTGGADAALPPNPTPAQPPGPGLVPTQQFVVPMPMHVQYWHRDNIHNAEHRKWANTDNAFKVWQERPDLIPEFTAHMQMHDLAAASKQMQAQQIQGMAAGGIAVSAPPGAQGTGQALERSNAESGNPADVPRGTGQGAQGRGPE